MKKIIFLLFLICFSGIAKSQQENLQEMLNRKQYNQIVALADQLQAADSSDFQTMYLIGQAYEGLLKYRDAYRFYQHCLLLDSEHVELINTTGRMAANLGKVEDAESYFLTIWKTDTTDFYANYQLARFYVQIGDDLKAIDYYENLLEHDPNNPALLRAVGDCYYRLKDGNSAFIAYWVAFQNNKENAGLASTVVNTLLPLPDEEKIEKALEVCDTALYYNPGNIRLLQNQGMTFFTGKMYAKADSVYSILLARGDSSYNTIKYSGTSKYYSGKLFDAIESLEKAHVEDPSDVEVCLLLGSALGRTAERKRALELFDWVEQILLPQNPAYTAYLAYLGLVLQFRADTYARDGRRQEAANIYYQQWLTTKRQDRLSQIWSAYGVMDVSKIEDDDIRARYIFVSVLIATETDNNRNNSGMLSFVRRQLVSFREDMFFRGIKEHPMIAPDNRRSTVTEARLQELIQKLPDSIVQGR
jgi:tetratricopeptide (TPR) repeat protein